MAHSTCSICSGHLVPHQVKDRVVIDARVVFAGTIPCQQCTECGAVVENAKDGADFQAKAVEKVVRLRPTGEAFEFLRAYLALTPEDLAIQFGVNPVTIQRWERGEREVPRTAWALLADMAADRAGLRSRGFIESLLDSLVVSYA